MKDPISAAEYTDRGMRAVVSVLVEIGQVLGSFKDNFAVIGGVVPSLLLKDGDPPHIGTLDVDLALDHVALDDGEYVSLVQALEDKGYLRGEDDMRYFQLRRTVDIGSGPPIPVIVDLLMPRRAKITSPPSPRLEKFAVQKAHGVAVALEHRVPVRVKGIMPDGRPNDVELHVAAIPAFLVMKGYALNGRDKMKDAYDIYYCIRNFPDGPEALADQCRPLLEIEEARKGYGYIVEKFATRDSYGPSTVSRFLSEAGMPSGRIAADAYFQVKAWIDALFARKE